MDLMRSRDPLDYCRAHGRHEHFSNHQVPMPKKRKASPSEGVYSQAEVQLRDFVEEVLEMLEIEGWFMRAYYGNNQMISVA